MATALAVDTPECKERFTKFHSLHEVCPACVAGCAKSTGFSERSFFSDHIPHAELLALLESKLIVVYVRPYGKPEIHVPQHWAFDKFFESLGIQHSSMKYVADHRCYLTPWTYQQSGWWATMEALNAEGFKITIKQSRTIKRGVTIDDDICNHTCKAGDPDKTWKCSCVCGGVHHAAASQEMKPLHRFHFVLDRIEGGVAHRTMTIDNEVSHEGLLIKELRESFIL